MNIETAKEILWPDYAALSDEQVLQIVDLFRAISVTLIEKEVGNI